MAKIYSMPTLSVYCVEDIVVTSPVGEGEDVLNVGEIWGGTH